MRNGKREITSRSVIDGFIAGCSTVRLGMVSQGVPYVVPVNFVYLNGTVYFHCACAGRKYQAIRQGGTVCLEFDTTLGIDAEGADTFYTSVIGWGTPHFCEGRSEKIRILGELCGKYLGKKRNISDTMADGTCVVGIRLDTVTGKENRG